jgi:Holliday junction DNA helicase RuvA
VIARLEGLLLEKSPTRLVVDVGGVGYALAIPLSTFERLPDEGKLVALHVHTHVREDALQLFGFASVAERTLFEILIQASRVGPRLAQTILSGMDAAGLVAAIRSGDVARLRRVPGIGAKSAERLVVELRERVEAAFPAGLPGRGEAATSREGPRDQLLSALVNLQVPRAQAERIVEQVVEERGEDAGIEALVRAALARLSA